MSKTRFYVEINGGVSELSEDELALLFDFRMAHKEEQETILKYVQDLSAEEKTNNNTDDI